MRLQTRLQVRAFSPDETDMVAAAALRLWAELPMRIQGTDELFDYLADYGCEIDGESVRFPQAVRDRVLDRIAAEKEAWLATNTEPPWPGNDISVYTHGQALIACDVETNELRPATTADLEQWSHVVDALEIPSRAHPTFIPTDAPTGCSDFHAYATILLNSKRPGCVSVYSAEMLPYFIEAYNTAQGSPEAAKKNAPFATRMWVNSPFMITRENVEIAMDARRLLGRPLSAAAMPVAGAATPVTVAGQAAQTTAESLALSAITLAVDDITTSIQTNALVMDMRAMAHRQAGPDVMLQRTAAAEMQCHFFGGWPRIWGFNASGQTVGPQTLLEKGMGTAIDIMSGARSVGCGSLACSDVGSLVQLVLDLEMADTFAHMLREVEISDERIDEETILATVPGGARFMETEHTFRHFREELWMPQFMDFRVPVAWRDSPTDMIDSARAKAMDLAATAKNQCPLSDDQTAAIRQLMDDARSQAGDTLRR
ncbi:MAG TPA: trimethylamine methyltransferase family protein [Armatimonadota bacterium]|nr:trimethylamine methyltransferase family protein [Armatimonadota bacterium]